MELDFKSFKLLHKHLIDILTTNNHENEHLAEKLCQYVEMIVQSDKTPQQTDDVFDYFCENKGVHIFKLVLEIDPLLAIRSLSLLFINLKQELFISYLLCQPFLTNAIEGSEDETKDEEWAQYFIAFLKSLSIRISVNQVSLFYNKKSNKLPLIYQAIKYYNHQDCMVRTNVMNIVLGIMKIKDERLSEYFSNFPFTSYILTYCCEIRRHVHQFHEAIKNGQLTRTSVKMYTVDFTDFIYYLNDLVTFGSDTLQFFINNTVLAYLVVPMLGWLKQVSKEEGENKSMVVRNIFYVLYHVLKIIKNKSFAESVCLLLLGKKLPPPYIHRMDAHPYIPKVYTQRSDDKLAFYWDNFTYEIEEHCLRIFKDIHNFEVDHDTLLENPQQKQLFMAEINLISEFLGFNILNYESAPQNGPITGITADYSLNENDCNPIRTIFHDLLKGKDVELKNLLTTMMISLIRNQYIDNSILKFCGILLPKMDTINYLDEFNIKSLNIMKDILITEVHSSLSKESSGAVCVPLIRNVLLLLDNILFKKCEQHEEQKIKASYCSTINQLKDKIQPSNIEVIVERFQSIYEQVHRDSLQAYDHEISFKIFLKAPKHQSSDEDNQREVESLIECFALVRTFYARYLRLYFNAELGRFSELYQERFGKVVEQWKVGHSYQIQERNIFDCQILQPTPKKPNNMSRGIMVEDDNNMVVVKPNYEENCVFIYANYPWKEVQLAINQGAKEIKVTVKDVPSFSLYFQDEIRCRGALAWMKDLNRRRYQGEQAFLLGFVRSCLKE